MAICRWPRFVSCIFHLRKVSNFECFVSFVRLFFYCLFASHGESCIQGWACSQPPLRTLPPSLWHFDLCCLCNSCGLLKLQQQDARFAVLRWRLPAKWKAFKEKNANQLAAQLPPLHAPALSATRNKCQLRICYVSYFCGGVGVGVGFLPLTPPLLYDDNKSRKATTTETQLGQLSVYIIDRPLSPPLSMPPVPASPTRRSVCLRDFFLTLVWGPRAHVPHQAHLPLPPVTGAGPVPAQPIPSRRANLLSLAVQKYRKENMKTVKNRYKIHI